MNNFSTVYALAVLSSNLYAGGEFTPIGGIPANHIAKWNGSAWSALGAGVVGGGTGNGAVTALAVSGSDLYVGGWFTNAGGTTANCIAKWNGSAWSALGSGLSSTVTALAASDSDLYVGGGFTMAGGKVSPYVAKAIAIPGDWLRIQNAVPGPGTNTLNYVGVPNARCLVQFATNLTTSPWFILATGTVAADGLGTVLDSAATNAQRFYRVRTP